MVMKNPLTKDELLQQRAEFKSFGQCGDFFAVMLKNDQKILYLKKAEFYYKVD
jgi:hypothetical protein